MKPVNLQLIHIDYSDKRSKFRHQPYSSNNKHTKLNILAESLIKEKRYCSNTKERETQLQPQSNLMFAVQKKQGKSVYNIANNEYD